MNPRIQTNDTPRPGFTIIEVVLVLAIAGLIFLMVFIALPALQKSQRDTQRREDYSALSSAMTTYMTNHNGSLPPDGTGDLSAENYVNKDGLDPNGLAYTIQVATGAGNCTPSISEETGTVVCVVKKTVCSEDGTSPTYKNSRRAFSIYGAMEGGETYCQSNI